VWLKVRKSANLYYKSSESANLYYKTSAHNKTWPQSDQELTKFRKIITLSDEADHIRKISTAKIGKGLMMMMMFLLVLTLIGHTTLLEVAKCRY
jgi:hypothetical protein